jgi:hypothetical protein
VTKSKTNARAEIFPARHSFWTGFAVVMLAFVAGAAWSWRKWADPLIDFGVQLYLPVRLAAGDVLYRDVTYLTGGPLSQYYHALLFKIFGASFLTLIVSNLAITAGMIALIQRWFHSAADLFTATAISVAVIFIFAFGQLIDVGDYSYAAPYSHEVLHGLALSILTVGLLANWMKKSGFANLCAAGFCFGLVFLTKPDIFMALAICVAAAFALFGFRKKQAVMAGKSFALFLMMSLVPLLFCFFLFMRVESWHLSLRSVAGAWQPLFATPVARNPFYQWCLGLDSPWLNLAKIAGYFLVIAGLAGLCAFLFRRINFSSPRRIFLIAFIALLLAVASAFDWADCGRALPLLNLTLVVILFQDFKKGGDDKIIFPLLWSIFSLALLGKLGLFPRIWHYGFALAMPALASTIYLLLWVLPRRFEKHGVPRLPFRITVSLVLFTGLLQLFVQSELRYAKKNVVLGQGGDRLFAFSPAVSVVPQLLGDAVSWLETNTSPSATLAVLPEGAIINYLTHRANPTPFIVWTPFDSAIFGETNLVSAFAKNCPDYIVLTYRNMDEFHTGYFGEDPNYGAIFKQWLTLHYQPVFSETGDEPHQQRKFNVQIFKRTGIRPGT